MDLVADLAEEYAFDEIRISHEQNIIFPHVAIADLEPLLSRAAAGRSRHRPTRA